MFSLSSNAEDTSVALRIWHTCSFQVLGSAHFPVIVEVQRFHAANGQCNKSTLHCDGEEC